MISTNKRRHFALAVASAAALALGTAQRAHAVTGSWTGAGADDSWTNPLNWDVIPGTADGTFVNTDTALFSGAPLLTTVTVDHNRNIGGIVFDNSSSSFTIGSSTGETLYLSNGGQIRFGSGLTGGTGSGTLSQTMAIMSPMVLAGTSYKFTADTLVNTNISMRLQGPISAGTNASTTLTLDGANTMSNQGPAQVWGVISDGAGTVGLVKNGTGIWELRPGGVTDASAAGTTFPTNTYTGQTVINQGMIRVSGPYGLSPNSEVVLNGNGATIRFSVNAASANNPGLHTVVRDIKVIGDASGSGTINASNANVQTIVAPPSGPAVTIDYSAFTGTFTPVGAILWFRGTTDGDGGVRYIGGPNNGATVWSAAIDLGDLNRPFDVSRGNTANPQDLDLSGSISGAGGIIKKGNGSLRIRNAGNPFTGQIEVQAGSLTFSNNNIFTGNPNMLIDGGTVNMGTSQETVNNVTLTSGAITSNTGTLTAASFALNVNGTDTGLITTNLTGSNASATITKTGTGSVNVGTLGMLSAGTVSANGGVLSFVTGRTDAVKLAGLVAGGGTVDLHDNDMIVSNTPTADIVTAIRTARNGGAWNQPGLSSTEARTTASHNTTLGVLTGAEYTGVGGTGTFDGTPYAATDTLVKYTYYGDSDFNGKVNFDDYVKTDNGFNNHLTGWLNGDFDGNGIVNFDDYVLIDLAFNTQNGTLRRALSFLDGGDSSNAGMNNPALARVQQHLGEFGSDYAQHFLAAVPEPGMLAVGVGLLPLLARRQRRHVARRVG